MHTRICLAVVVSMVAAPSAGAAQGSLRTVSGKWVGSPAEEYIRLLQLTGVMPLSSLMIRPTSVSTNWTPPDSATWRSPWSKWYTEPHAVNADRRRISTVLYHPHTHATYNSGFPYGFNDGVMWAGRGLSVAQTVGGSASVGPVTLDILPTFTWSENKNFELGPLYNAPPTASPYADVMSSRTIDRPQRFGEEAIARLDPGQSALTLEIGDARVGVAHRNMWWGPGTENALILTNNAGGFPHAFAATRRPVSVGIGRLEAMWVVGAMRQSRYWRTAADTFATDRWLNGLTLVFAPKGASGLYLGATRLFYAYQRTNPITPRELLSLFQPFNKEALADSANPLGNDSRDQLLSLSFRWVFPQVGFEAYGEWGRNDHNWDLRDLVLQLDHSRAVTVGARKVLRLRNGILALAGEHTNLAFTTSILGRSVPTWYAHFMVQQGFTQGGQVIGAGIGPGSEQQSLLIDWYRPAGHIGWVVQRHRDNLDGFYGAGLRDRTRIVGSVSAGPRASVFAGSVEVTGSYRLQYEFNRYAISGNDHRNHRVEIVGQVRLP